MTLRSAIHAHRYAICLTLALIGLLLDFIGMNTVPSTSGLCLSQSKLPYTFINPMGVAWYS
jgi:hypothetical protein